jgi:hypothetical protein
LSTEDQQPINLNHGQPPPGGSLSSKLAEITAAAAAVAQYLDMLKDLESLAKTPGMIGPDHVTVTVAVGGVSVHLPPDSLSYPDPPAMLRAMSVAVASDLWTTVDRMAGAAVELRTAIEDALTSRASPGGQEADDAGKPA